MRRAWIILLPLAVSLILLAAIYVFAKPYARSFITQKLQNFSENNLPVKVSLESLDWELLLIPKVLVKNLKIESKSTDLPIPTTEIENITLRLDVLFLFVGQLALSSVDVDGLKTEVDLDPLLSDSSPAQRLPIDALFSALEELPLKRLEFANANIHLNSNKVWKKQIQLNEVSLQINNLRNQVAVDFSLPHNLLQNENQQVIPFSLDASLNLNSRELQIRTAKIQALGSVLALQGSLPQIANITLVPRAQLRYSLTSQLNQLHESLKPMFELPELYGNLQARGTLDMQSLESLTGDIHIKTEDLRIEDFEVDSISTELNLTPGKMQSKLIRLSSDAANIELQNLDITYDRKSILPMQIQTSLKTDALDLHQLLLQLTVGDIPLELFVNGKLDCGGTVDKSVDIKCNGDLHADELEVRSGTDPNDATIVRVSDFSVNGNVTITEKAISYDANINVGENTGKSHGEISYEKGFDLKYESDGLDFAKIDYLAGLKLEGVAALTGFTRGHSKSAVFQMKLNGQEVAFEDYLLGQVQTQLRYNKGNLIFEDLQGQMNQTTYFAEIELDLLKSEIKIEGQSPSFSVADVEKIVSRIIPFPFTSGGTGDLQIQLHGPLKLNELSYNLFLQLQKGHLSGESFDYAGMQADSISGQVDIKNGIIKKASSTATFSGTVNPQGLMNIQAQTRQFPLEISEAISGAIANLYGEVDLDVLVTGPIINPNLKLTGKLENLTVEDETLATSEFDIELSRARISGTTNIMKNQLLADFRIPFDDSSFYLKFKANQWNFTRLAMLTGTTSLLGNYRSNLTGELDLESERGGLFTSSGNGQIDQLYLQRDDIRIENKNPIILTANNGRVSLRDFFLSGRNTQIQVKGDNFSAQDLGLSILANVDLRLFQIFTPFLDELAGQAVMDVRVTGDINRPEVLGVANIEEGFVKIKGFPHPIEKLDANAQFSQYRINLSQVSGYIAGGQLSGQGQVRIEGIRNVPTDIRLQLRGGSFNVPDRIRTSGDLDLNFSGQWFPFTLAGTYNVKQGFVDKEFDDEGGPQTLKQSSFLPKVILQSNFEPIVLDLDVMIERNIEVKNSLIEGTLNGRLNIKGPPENPSILGKLNGERNTKLFFRDKLFEASTLSVNFADPNEINPELFVSARSRVNEYDITLMVQGNAKTPLIRLSSLPPLPETDIISLLALGVTSTGLQQQVDRMNNNNQGNTLGQSAIENAFGAAIGNVGLVKDIQRRAGVNLQFSSQYDDTKNLNVQKITVSKKVSDRLNASASQLQGGKSAVEVKLEYQLNQNVSAVGSFERREPIESTSLQDDQRRPESIFGLDLEFKQEFR